MFLNIFYTFWKLIILTSLLVIAFSLSFYMVFNEPGILFSRSPFADPARSILKTMTMITGELDFDAIFKQTPGGVLTAADVPGQVPFPEVSYMLWIIFLILMPILLSNLLVCTTHIIIVPCGRKYLPGENFRQFRHLLARAKFLSHELFVIY